jgi:transcriptional regulator with XRE-family HTH domain
MEGRVHRKNKTSNEMECWRDVRENIKYFRGLKGWTQADLSERIGCGEGRISKLEQGSIKFTQSSITAVCKALDISIEQLFVSHRHYLNRVSPREHARVKNTISRFYSILTYSIPEFFIHYLAGVLNTYDYDPCSKRIYYKIAEALNISRSAVDHHRDVFISLLKTHIEKSLISLATEELLKEKTTCYFSYKDIENKIEPIYKFLSSIMMESDNFKISFILRIPIYVKETKDIFGGLWVCFNGGKKITGERLKEVEREINNAIWKDSD